ncbi:MAG: Spy/CpxP family protein refolding chaperone [Burkholderiaceae bacterium]
MQTATTIINKAATLSARAASIALLSAVTAFSVSAYATPTAMNPSAQATKGFHLVGHHRAEHRAERKGHRKHHGHRKGMRAMLKGLNLSEAQRDQIFEIRHANMPALREQRKEIRAARKALKALAVQGAVDQAQLQVQATALGEATAAMATLRVRSMEQVMGVLDEQQADSLRQKMAKRAAK